MNNPLRRLSVVVSVLFAILLASSTWVQYADANALNHGKNNTRTQYKEFGRPRGPILVANTQIAQSVAAAKGDPYQYLRRYPKGAQYAPITGYFSLGGGSTGLEAAANDLLAGTADQLFYRRITDLLTGKQPQGAAIELTINAKAQQAAWDGLGDQRGAVVALDPRTGDILAMVSKPSYDPNVQASHDIQAVNRADSKLNKDPNRPKDNRAIAGRLYNPGSTFKLVTAAAALSSGKFTPDSLLPGPARLDLPQSTATIPNEDGRPCGANDQVTMTDALRISCNTAFASLGLELGDQALRDQAAKFGFGAKLSVPLPVTSSQFPATLDAPHTAQSAIGQFDVRASPLEMAMVTAGIANKGVVMTPNLIRSIRAGSDLTVIDQPSPKPLSTAITPDVAAQLTTMMKIVVTNGTGTNAQIPGIEVAGKTGTAQQGDTGKPPNVWFVSFAPADNPQVAVAVVVEDGGNLGARGSGGAVAAPIAKAVMQAVLNK